MSRTNACSEIAKFWLQARHGCLVDESIPVPVPRAQSDIDLVAMKADMTPLLLPDGIAIGPRVIVETKDEHDWEPSGKEFGALLRQDVSLMHEGRFIPGSTTGSKFTMLRQQHYERATELFGTDDFDRLFVVHAIDPSVRLEVAEWLAARRIYWITIPEVVRDLLVWYDKHPRPSGLRHTEVGDILHLLVGFCGLRLPIN